MPTHNLTVRRITDEEIKYFIELMQDLDNLYKELKIYPLETIDFTQFKTIGEGLDVAEDAELVIEIILKKISTFPYPTLILNLDSLISGCVAKNEETLSYNSKLSTAIELLEKVPEMRAAQKEYFSSRKKTALFKAKELEKEIDQIIKEYNIEKNEN